jgi:hypothetical protein
VPDPVLLLADGSPLLLWVGGSILAYVVAANLTWWIRSTAFSRSPYGLALLQAGRFVYYLVVPYLALGGWRPRLLGWLPQQGLLALEDVGLVGPGLQWPVTRWLEAAGTGLGLGLLALLVLGLAWAIASHLFRTGRTAATISFAPRPWWALLISGLYLEIHWAFYRGGLGLALGDVYAGVFWGLAAVCLEWILNPSWRAGWPAASRAGHVWLNAGLALTSALLFLLTRNLWVCLAIHWLLVLAFWLLARHRRAVGAGHSSTSDPVPEGGVPLQRKPGTGGRRAVP